MAKSYPDLGTFTSGQILTAAKMNDVATIADNVRVPALCYMKKDSAQALGNGVYTALTWSSTEEIYDTDGMHSTSTNTSRITPTTAGLYLFTFQDAVSGTTTGHNLAIRINAGDLIALTQCGLNQYGNSSIMYPMNGTTDYVEAMVFVDGAGRTVNLGAGVPTTFSALWVGQYT